MMTTVKQARRAHAGGATLDAVRVALRRLARTVLFPGVEACNASIFKLAGHLLRPRAKQLVLRGEERVLVIAPHPDDETLGCGGTLSLHTRAGDRVCVLIVTDGGRSRAGGLDSQTMVALRHEEARQAISALSAEKASVGIDLVQLGLPEGRWPEEELVNYLATILGEMKPTIIYTTSRVDFHPEHLRVAHAVAKALRREAGEYLNRVRVYELQVPLTPVLANVVANVSARQPYKETALNCYRTQAGSFLWVQRHARYLRALYRSKGPVEVFWEMEPIQYIVLHENAIPLAGPDFRSIRLRPFTDLAAWVIGIRARQALRRLAG